MLALAMPDWNRLAEHPTQALLSVLILAGAGVLGGLLLGFVVRAVALFVWRDLSSAWVLRLRIVGGIASAILAYSFLGSGDGFGWGPGPGGLPGRGPGDGDLVQLDTATDRASRPADSAPSPLPTEPAPPASDQTLYVQLLGGSTSPVFVEVEKRFFSFPTDPSPRPLTFDEVMHRIQAEKEKGQVRRVRLLVPKEASDLGVYLIDHLRAKVTKEVRLDFVQPPPKDLLSEKVVTFQAE